MRERGDEKRRAGRTGEAELASLRRRAARIPRVRLALLPTPLHRLERLSAGLGLPLYVKRDDLTGPAFGGNKARKLEYPMAEALARRAEVVLTTGAAQSNHARLTASAAAMLGLPAHLVLGGDGRRCRGNLLIDRLLGATLHFPGTEDWDELTAALERLASRLEAEGRRVYTIPLGGSVPLGALGYVRAAGEVAAQERRLGLRFSHIFHASSSAGTQAGLLVGCRLHGLRARVVGIGVAKTSLQIEEEVWALARETAVFLGGPPSLVPRQAVVVDDSYRGPEYGVSTPEGERAVAEAARLEGLILDRIYSGKGMAGTLDDLRRGISAPGKGQAALFIHTGGSVELFA